MFVNYIYPSLLDVDLCGAVYVKDRWEGLPPIPGAGQVEAMLTI